MSNGKKYTWVLLVAIASLLARTGIIVMSILKKPGGHLVYFLDDAYIHMAIAKNIAEWGVWGITRYGFSSSSSSPLWTLLLSGIYYVFGKSETAPLILNVIFSIATVFVLYEIFRKEARHGYEVLCSLILIILPVQLHLIISGMEHSLQVLIFLVLAYNVSMLATKDYVDIKGVVLLSILSFLATAVRYEGLFLVVSACFVFIVNKRYRVAPVPVVSGSLPVIMYGVFSKLHGGLFFPNSILVKSGTVDFRSGMHLLRFAGYTFFNNINSIRGAELLVVLLICTVMFVLGLKEGVTTYKENFLLCILLTGILDVQFSNIGNIIGYFRYEAYLIVLGLAGIFISIYSYLPNAIPARPHDVKKWGGLFFLSLFIIAPLIGFGIRSFYLLPQASLNIYEQQYSLGLLVRDYMDGRTVVLNDVGAINWLADIKCIDLEGIGTNDVTRERSKTLIWDPDKGMNVYAALDAEEIGRFAKDADVAFVDNDWFSGFPDYWVPVGKWVIPDNVVCGNSEVSVYAIKSSEQDYIRSVVGNLANYMPEQ